MNQAHTESTNFWAGGSEEFHRQRRERNLGKGFIGLMNRILRRMINIVIAPISREIDERLFMKKSGRK